MITAEQRSYIETRIDEAIGYAVVRTEIGLKEVGREQDEIKAILTEYRADLAKWRAETIADIVRTIEHPDAPTTRLQ